MSIAIVTGASSGLGAEFCRRLDEMNLDCIWLIARRKELMEEVASSMKTETRIFPIDLTDRDSLDGFIDTIKKENPEIQFLINNAGFGRFGNTWEIPLETTRSMIDLNVTALVSITAACVPFMKEGSHIIEIASEAGYIGLAGLNVYASSKAFVKHFCTGLRGELKSRNISVTEVSPGWIETDFIPIATGDAKVPSKIFAGRVKKEDVVDHALKCALKGKKRSVCGFKIRVMVTLSMYMYNTFAKIWIRSMKG